MRDILADLIQWQKDGQSVAVATVVQTWGSSPRRAGAKMALASDGRISGSVSGGCVENAVFEAGVESLKSDRPQLLHFGVTDETAWDVGLACGGSIDVFIKPLDEQFFQSLRAAWTDENPSVHVTAIRGSANILGREVLVREDGSILGNIGRKWHERVLDLAKESLAGGVSHRTDLDDETEVFVECISPPPALIVVGGVHIATALISLAKVLGFRTILIDPRKVWGNEERFPNIDKLIQAWPDDAFQQIRITRSTAIALLTHDPKIDDPAARIALNSNAFYVGALGSKTTNAKRRERLLNDGLNESRLSRLRAPIGLDIGAANPEEIALSIMAEVVEAYRKQDQLPVKKEAEPVSSL
jgi:xanthine dehydrogenase accessory factor